jgi:hypothetical protein
LIETNQRHGQGQNLCQSQRVDPGVNQLVTEDQEAGKDQPVEGKGLEAAVDQEVEAEDGEPLDQG